MKDLDNTPTPNNLFTTSPKIASSGKKHPIYGLLSICTQLLGTDRCGIWERCATNRALGHYFELKDDHLITYYWDSYKKEAPPLGTFRENPETHFEGSEEKKQTIKERRSILDHQTSSITANTWLEEIETNHFRLHTTPIADTIVKNQTSWLLPLNCPELCYGYIEIRNAPPLRNIQIEEKTATEIVSFLKLLGIKILVSQRFREANGELGPEQAHSHENEAFAASLSGSYPGFSRELTSLIDSTWKARASDSRETNTLKATERLLFNALLAHEEIPPAQAKPRLNQWQLNKIEKFISENLSQTLLLNELATLLGMSPSHFARAFRNSTGAPPGQYIIQKRLQTARHSLSQGKGNTVAEVALSCGFCDQSHLGRHFRRHYGYSPSAYLAKKNTLNNPQPTYTDE